MSLSQVASEVDGAFDSIPIIDLGNVSVPGRRVAVAQEIRDACMQVGFFYINNHGILQETIDRLYLAMQGYFSLPVQTKMKLYHKETANFKGYNPFLDSNIDSANDGDLHEGFEIGWEELVSKEIDEKRANDGAMAGANIWPAEPVGFREACLNYYHAVVGVGKVLFRLFALALELPETYFDDKTKNFAATMRTHHYPPRSGQKDRSAFGIGAHTDFECFTILWQEPGIQALQVKNSEGLWIDAPPIPGTLVINIGDQLARWTNDMFKSTVHRVSNNSGFHRYSVPLFFGTDYHVQIETIPSCVSPDRPAKYEPINAGDYVQKRLQGMYRETKG